MSAPDSQPAALSEQDLVAALRVGRVTAVTPHGRGMKSAIWLIASEHTRWIAKAVPAQAAAQFEAGLADARRWLYEGRV